MSKIKNAYHDEIEHRRAMEDGMADDLVERVRDFVYDCTTDGLGSGWTLSGGQVRELIAIAAAPEADVARASSGLCELHRKMLSAVRRGRPYPVSIRLGASDTDAVLNGAVALERARDQLTALSHALDDLQQAEAEYRLMHDRHGDAAQATGRAWDLMRRAGDKARATQGGSNEPV